jgi:hypothetical protein
LFSVKTFFSSFVVPPLIKGRGWAFFIIGVSLLHLILYYIPSRSHIATDGQSVILGVEPYLWLMTRYVLLFDNYGLAFVGRPL